MTWGGPEGQTEAWIRAAFRIDWDMTKGGLKDWLKHDLVWPQGLTEAGLRAASRTHPPMLWETPSASRGCRTGVGSGSAHRFLNVVLVFTNTNEAQIFFYVPFLRHDELVLLFFLYYCFTNEFVIRGKPILLTPLQSHTSHGTVTKY